MAFDSFQPIITEQDQARLAALLASSSDDKTMFLEEELARAHVVAPPNVPPDVVTMNSIVEFIDLETNTIHQVALVYPNNADASEGRVSVLAPIGAALLGLRAGQEFVCPLPNGSERRIRVLSVNFQPESLGVFDL